MSSGSSKFGRASAGSRGVGAKSEADEEFGGAEEGVVLEEAEVLLDTLEGEGPPQRRAGKPRGKDKDSRAAAGGGGAGAGAGASSAPRPLPVIVKDVEMLDKSVAARLQTKQRRAVPSAGRGKGAFDAKQWEASRGGPGSDPDVSFSLGEILRRSSKSSSQEKANNNNNNNNNSTKSGGRSKLISRQPSQQLQEQHLLQQQQQQQQQQQDGSGERRKVFKPKKSGGARKESKDADGKTAMDRRMEAQADTAQIDLEGISDDKERFVKNENSNFLFS